MIRQLRVDERMIHGQITTNWARVLDIDAIIVANDATAENEIVKRALLLAAPPGKKVLIKKVEEVITLLDDPRAETVNSLLIVDNLQDAITLVEKLPIKAINVANFKKKKGEKNIHLTEYLIVTEDDYERLKHLCEIGEDVYSQMLPNTKKVTLRELLK